MHPIGVLEALDILWEQSGIQHSSCLIGIAVPALVLIQHREEEKELFIHPFLQAQWKKAEEGRTIVSAVVCV